MPMTRMIAGLFLAFMMLSGCLTTPSTDRDWPSPGETLDYVDLDTNQTVSFLVLEPYQVEGETVVPFQLRQQGTAFGEEWHIRVSDGARKIVPARAPAHVPDFMPFMHWGSDTGHVMDMQEIAPDVFVDANVVLAINATQVVQLEAYGEADDEDPPQALHFVLDYQEGDVLPRQIIERGAHLYEGHVHFHEKQERTLVRADLWN